MSISRLFHDWIERIFPRSRLPFLTVVHWLSTEAIGHNISSNSPHSWGRGICIHSIHIDIWTKNIIMTPTEIRSRHFDFSFWKIIYYITTYNFRFKNNSFRMMHTLGIRFHTIFELSILGFKWASCYKHSPVYTKYSVEPSK